MFEVVKNVFSPSALIYCFFFLFFFFVFHIYSHVFSRRFEPENICCSEVVVFPLELQRQCYLWICRMLKKLNNRPAHVVFLLPLTKWCLTVCGLLFNISPPVAVGVGGGGGESLTSSSIVVGSTVEAEPPPPPPPRPSGLRILPSEWNFMDRWNMSLQSVNSLSPSALFPSGPGSCSCSPEHWVHTRCLNVKRGFWDVTTVPPRCKEGNFLCRAGFNTSSNETQLTRTKGHVQRYFILNDIKWFNLLFTIS